MKEVALIFEFLRECWRSVDDAERYLIFLSPLGFQVVKHRCALATGACMLDVNTTKGVRSDVGSKRHFVG